MSQRPKAVVVGVLVILGLTASGLQRSRGEIHYNGGFVITNMTRPAASPPAPRYEPAAPMQFGYIRHAYPAAATAYVPSAGAQYDFARAAPARVTPALYEVSTAALPWKQAGFEDYDEPAAEPGRDLAPGRAAKYSLVSTPLVRRDTGAHRDIAVLIAYLPEDAVLWVEGKLTASKGRTRYFESPPLVAGVKYSYRVRVAWVERGRLVSQVREVPVQAGRVEGVYLTLSPAEGARKRQRAIETNLAKLDPGDREVARLQEVCLVRPDTRLGETGVPIKVMVKNHRVFVCTAEDVAKVLADPARMWAKAQELRARHAKQARK